MIEVARGAEAVIFKDDEKIIKKRIVKDYRIKEIDDKLRSGRTKREAKILSKLWDMGFSVPKLLRQDKFSIEMEFIPGDKVRDILETGDYLKLSLEIGKLVGILHNHDIIHSDLTTSNMIFSDGKIFFIDFGLSFFSKKAEDMAVDLHLLRQALESKHHTIWKECFDKVVSGYKENLLRADEILGRFKLVEARGRNKAKC